jgi:predicted kinase
MRMILTGDESNQEKNPLVFKTLENMVGYFMSLGKNLLIDATNYNWKNRKTWNRLADKYCYNKTWMVFKTSLEQCLENNQKRERKVPNWVIENQYNGLTLPLDEGGEIVYIIQNETL